MQAIETRYAGCRFRSRLEARWAVFFDRLGISWEYEPQGYLVGASSPRPYLPDFWLSDPGIWVEVKGAEDQLDVELLVEAALPHDGLPAAPLEVDGYRPRLLILGPIQQAGWVTARPENLELWCQPTHAVLSFRKGDLFQGQACFTSKGLSFESLDGGLVANDGTEIFWPTRGIEWGNWVGGGAALNYAEHGSPQIQDAYRGARSARFEHGQGG